MKTTYTTEYWESCLNRGHDKIIVETGRCKGVYPQTVKAFARLHNLDCHNEDCGIWIMKIKR